MAGRSGLSIAARYDCTYSGGAEALPIRPHISNDSTSVTQAAATAIQSEPCLLLRIQTDCVKEAAAGGT